MKKVVISVTIIFLTTISVSIILWLVNQNFPATGEYEIIAVLGQDTPRISQLGPPPRVKLENDYQLMLEGPIYFDMRSPRWFDNARIEIEFQNGERTLKGLGGQVGASDWQYLLKEPLEIVDLGNGWQKAIFFFDLDQLHANRNINRFLVDTQGQTPQSLKIRSIKAFIRL